MSRRLAAIALTASLALAACAVGPNYHRPALSPTAGYGAAAEPAAGAPAFDLGADVPGDWWRIFHSQALDELVAQALRNNPTIAAARAALRAAHETVLAQKGAYFPSLGASLQPTDQRFAGTLASPTAANAYDYALTTAQLTVSYTPDIFGANRRAVENLAAQEDAQRFELEAARVSLATNVVTAALQDASLRAQIAATQEIIAAQRQTLDSLGRQHDLGQASDADVAAQAAQLAQSEATLPPLQKALDINAHALADLVGRTPAQADAAPFDLDTLTLPSDAPVSLPARLVDQRPDVRMAEAQLHAASASIGVAVAARLPNLDIEASAGSATLGLGLSLSNEATFWSVAATLVQPIVDGGTLLHKQKAAEAAYDQAKAQYEATVVAAFQNTADALTALRADTAAEAADARAAAAAARSLEIARAQRRLGDISELALLVAEQTDAQARLALAQAEGTQYADVAALYQALGGGWWNDPGARNG